MKDLIISADHIRIVVEKNLRSAEHRGLIDAGYYLGMYDALMIIASQIAGGGLEGDAIMRVASQAFTEAIHDGIMSAVASTGIHPGLQIGAN